MECFWLTVALLRRASLWEINIYSYEGLLYDLQLMHNMSSEYICILSYHVCKLGAIVKKYHQAIAIATMAALHMRII